MNIPCKYRPLGNGGLPPGYVRVDFLESSQGGLNNILSFISVPTEVNSINDSFAVETLHKVPKASQKYQEGVNCTYWSFHSIWDSTRQWLCHLGETYVYTGLSNEGPLKIRVEYSPDNKSIMFSYGDYKESINIPEKYAGYVWPVNPLGVFWDADNPRPTDGHRYNAYAMLGKKWWWKFYLNGKLKNYLLPALDPRGAACMFDIVSGTTFYNLGSIPFIVGIKDVAQLRAALRSLPDLTGRDMGTLTLSIPAEANIPEMQELLDTTEVHKNWELTIQERAAEVATYSLRRVRKVVWVRKLSVENGSYVDASGLRWQTEWCSAIYSPLGNDPTLHGYEPFDSVEQAVEAWCLVPYEEPELEKEEL